MVLGGREGCFPSRRWQREDWRTARSRARHSSSRGFSSVEDKCGTVKRKTDSQRMGPEAGGKSDGEAARGVAGKHRRGSTARCSWGECQHRNGMSTYSLPAKKDHEHRGRVGGVWLRCLISHIRRRLQMTRQTYARYCILETLEPRLLVRRWRSCSEMELLLAGKAAAIKRPAAVLLLCL